MQDRRDRMAVIGAGPVGLGMEIGQKPPALHLINPSAALRQIRRAKRLMPQLLLRVERRLRRRIRRETPPLASQPPLAWPNADLTVY